MLKIENLTLEEKIDLLSGKSGDIVAKKYGKKYLKMSDGPHGLKVKGIVYPNMCLASSSWDKDALFALGRFIANDCISEGVDVLLGPSVNIKRTPLCGRNFEYISEDPFLAGTLGAAFINGIESEGVFSCVKHFCCYNQEKNRFTQKVYVDESTLMNLYIRVFYILLQKSSPSFLMTSYNSVNGELVSQNSYLLKDVLKGILKYNGIVITDWGGVDYRRNALAAGVDINMPGDEGITRREILDAISQGKISLSSIDESVKKVIEAIERASVKKEPKKFLPEDIKRITAESMVLLKNEGMLPLSKEDSLAVIGSLAKEPYIQGGGCAEVACESVLSPYDEIAKWYGKEPAYSAGYTLTSHSPSEDMISDAAETAKKCGKVLLFLGNFKGDYSEGYDRSDISLSESQVALLTKLYEVNRNIIVILNNGSALEMADIVKNSAAILECWMPGQFYAEVLTDVLKGKVNPCGRLAETLPLRFEDCSGYRYYVDDNDIVNYGDGELVGYKYNQSTGIVPAYPFGYGLSYTSFEYMGFEVSQKVTDGKNFSVTVTLKNTGKMGGKEVIQIYLKRKGEKTSALAAFEKVFLAPGEEKEVAITLDELCFKRYSLSHKDYVIQPGEYIVSVNRNSLEVIAEREIKVAANNKINRYTKIDDLRKIGNGPELIKKYLAPYIGKVIYDDESYGVDFDGRELCGDAFFKNIAKSLPLYYFTTLTGGMLSNDELDKIIDTINTEIVNE